MKTTDEVVQATFMGLDDHRWEKEQQRKRAPKTKPPIELPDGACCGRCRNWLSPIEDETYGECGVLSVTTMSAPGFERGHIFGPNEREKWPAVQSEPLRTTGACFACSGFMSRGVVAA